VTQPNVVIIYADDLGWGDLRCYGGADLQTPHLDALAERGVRCRQWYSNSPVCSPSRAALLTGRHPAHAGVEAILGANRHLHGLPQQPTLASRLREAGYRTGIFGKWHLGVAEQSAPLAYGFDTHVGFRAGCVDYYSHIMYWGVRYPLHDLWCDNTEIWSNGRYLTDLITDSAVQFIESSDRPFFCYVPYNAPHYPMHAPAAYMDRFAHLPWERQVMAAMINCMDDGVGRIVAALERTGMMDNTMIIFSSDNGPSAEERNWLDGEEIAYPGGSTGGLRGHKGSLYEGGIRVPGIWSWPDGLPAGTMLDDPAAMIDIVPTVLAACGVDLDPSATDGVDLLPSLRGQDAVADRDLCWEYEGQLAVRRHDWKLVIDPSPKLGVPARPGNELYDLRSDPEETKDLSAEHPTVVGELSAAAQAWRQQLDSWRWTGR
jgi:arylsulfatase A-like enzyme